VKWVTTESTPRAQADPRLGWQRGAARCLDVDVQVASPAWRAWVAVLELLGEWSTGLVLDWALDLVDCGAWIGEGVVARGNAVEDGPGGRLPRLLAIDEFKLAEDGGSELRRRSYLRLAAILRLGGLACGAGDGDRDGGSGLQLHVEFDRVASSMRMGVASADSVAPG